MLPGVHRLDGRKTTLLLLDRTKGLPEIVHWGIRLPDGLDAGSVGASRSWVVPRGSLQGVGPEAGLFPTLGGGLFHAPSFAGHRAGRDWTAGFEVDDIEQHPDRLPSVANPPLMR